MARSSFYYHLSRLTTQKASSPLAQHIQSLYEQHKGNYGYRRIHLALRAQGYEVNHKRVYRIMRELGLQGRSPKRKRYHSFSHAIDYQTDNLLKRDFQAAKPLTRLVTDITQIRSKTDDQWLYLSSLMDLFNGEIIDAQMHTSPTVKLVSDMFNNAALKALPESCVCHSDQGIQYKNPRYRHLLKDKGIQQSMSRKGNCYDNARMESFFGTLKHELQIEELEKLPIKQMKRVIRRYIHYFNEQRITLKLKMSPLQYRLAYGAQIA